MSGIKIIGDIGIGGLGYINAIVISKPNKIYSPIRFCADTGSSVTIICHLDALRIGLEYNILQKSDQQSISGVGVFMPYVLPAAEILFNFEGTSLLEYVGDIHVMPAPPPSTFTSSKTDDKSNNSIQMSLLGMDVLKKYTISFSKDIIILGK